MGQLWVESLGTLFGRFPDYVRTRTGRRAIQLDAAVLAGVSALLVAGTIAAPGLVLRLWLAPLLVTFCGVLPATGMSEHYGCALEGDAFATTRTVLSNRAFRFLVWNNNFHVVHHLLPSVPFHQAPKLHAYIEPRLQHLSPSYLAFHGGILAACGRRPVAVPSSSASR
jgi:fatty acid desaturase